MWPSRSAASWTLTMKPWTTSSSTENWTLTMKRMESSRATCMQTQVRALGRGAECRAEPSAHLRVATREGLGPRDLTHVVCGPLPIAMDTESD